MAQTIHYTIPIFPMLLKSGTIPQHPHEDMVHQAEELAIQVLTELDFPHTIRRTDLRNSQDKKPSQFIYGFKIYLHGPGATCEELTFGWNRDVDANWTGTHFCKTQYATHPRKTHSAVVQVIQAWDQAGFIEQVLDDGHIYQKPKPKTEPQATGQQLSLGMTQADPDTGSAEPPDSPNSPATPPKPAPPEPHQPSSTPVQQGPRTSSAPQDPGTGSQGPSGDTQTPPAVQPRRPMLITQKERKKLRTNWNRSGKEPPVVKIFNPAGAATWIIHSLDPSDEDTLFGLCDLGMGCPELGYVSLSELEEVRPRVKLIIKGRTMEMPVYLERDRHFRPTHSLMVYADAARAQSGITEHTDNLERAATRQLTAGRP